MAKLLVYRVCVYLAPCPHHACDSLTSYSYCASGFYSAGDSSTFSYFCYVPGQVLTGNPPLSSSDHGPDPDSVLPNRVPHRGHCRGLAAAAFWPSFAVPHLAGRTDVLARRISIGVLRQVGTFRSPSITLMSRHLKIFWQTCWASSSCTQAVVLESLQRVCLGRSPRARVPTSMAS